MGRYHPALADAHTRYANFLGNRKADYPASPQVWSDITSVYDEYLKYHPQDHVAEQVRVACLRFPALPSGTALFQKLGNNLTSWREVPNYPLETLKSFRDYPAKVAARAKVARP